MAALRIASLLASATEIVAALGARDLLVARSHECDFPLDVFDLPAVTAPKFDTARSSAAIDRDVKSLLDQALSVYRVDAQRLRELAPDLIVTQTQCEVCAVSPRDVEEALAAWTGERPRIVSLTPNTLSDIFADIVRVGEALGRPAHGHAVVDNMRARIDDISRRAAALPHIPSVACIEWIEPLMAAGNWMPELVTLAGGRNLFGEAGRHSPWMTFEALIAADPDIILVLPCGFDIPRAQAELPALTTRPGWRDLRAVRGRHIYVCDGNQYFNRPGPRLVDSLEILAEVFHPAVFRFDHENIGWARQ